MNFDFNPDDRNALWNHVLLLVENFYAHTQVLPVSPELDASQIQAYITGFSQKQQKDSLAIIDHVVLGMTRYTVHTAHPAYFGLFNPRPNFPGILADTLTAAFNPQLAAWSHAPFAVEVECYLVKYFGRKFGYQEQAADGVFASGGAEANLTALLCALNHYFPAYAESGVQSLKEKPIIYCSSESHHSIVKSVRIAGLGSDSIRSIPTDKMLRMDVDLLKKQLKEDRQNGFFPLMIIATAGTTGSGAIDPLAEIAAIANSAQIWYHLDAAYGGGLALSSLSSLLNGAGQADSITFDAHKWLSVPMCTSMFLTRHSNILGQTFRITAEYMPKEASQMPITDPYVHSIQWSRRFTGLKLYLSMLMLGEEGYRETIDNQIRTGKLLKQRLIEQGWEIYNDTELPVICFGKPAFKEHPEQVARIVNQVIGSGKAWLSAYPINGVPSLRACITNYNTTELEIETLLEALNGIV
jgi:aromatic-L-amino-acid decarboxylase